MQVVFKSRDSQAAELLELSQRRARFVLRRLAWLVPHATIRMSDVNGPRGGIDKRCQVELKTDVVGTVVVTSVASDWRSALDKALERAERFVLRLVRRGGDPRRLRQREIVLATDEPQPLTPLHPEAPKRIISEFDNRP